MDDKGRKYRWKGLAPGSTPFVCLVHSYGVTSAASPLLVQLTTEEDNYGSSVARFNRSRRIYDPPYSFSSPSDATLRTIISSGASVLSLSPTLTDTASISPTLTDGASQASPQRRFTPATLEMLPRAIEIQDLVVMSFLFLEKNRRTRDQGGLSNERVLYPNLAPMSAC